MKLTEQLKQEITKRLDEAIGGETQNLINRYCYYIQCGRYRIEPEDIPRLVEYLKSQLKKSLEIDGGVE